MAEYIDRQTVIDTLDGLCDIVCQYSKKQRAFMCGACNLGSAFDVLQELPAADVRPVKRGKWTRIDYKPHGHDYKCSVCGWKNDMPTNFCPNCCAYMREES